MEEAREKERQVHRYPGSRVQGCCRARKGQFRSPDRKALYLPTTKRTGK